MRNHKYSFFPLRSFITSINSSSVFGSKELVASSRNKISGFTYSALATNPLNLPTDNRDPLSPILV